MAFLPVQDTRTLWQAAHDAYTRGEHDRSAALYGRAAERADSDSLAVVLMGRQAAQLGFAKKHIKQEQVLTEASIRADAAGLDSLRLRMAVSAQNVRDNCVTGEIECGVRVYNVSPYVGLGIVIGAFLMLLVRL